jgi:nucleoid-associated protein YgaU
VVEKLANGGSSGGRVAAWLKEAFMRREAKLGIFITLSAGLVVAVLTGRAITNGGPAKEGRVALASDKSVDKDASDILEALQQNSAPRSSQAARSDEAVDALVAQLPPAKHDLSAPVSANDEMKRYLEGGKNSPANSDVADILEILDKTSGAGPAVAKSGSPAVTQTASHTTAADISVSAESSPAGKSSASGTSATSQNDLFHAADSVSPAPKMAPPAVSSTTKSSIPASDMSTLDRLERAALASEPAVKTSAPVEVPKKDSAMDYLSRIENKTLGIPSENTTTYKVKDGDSFWTIAEKFYGSGARFNDIAKANPSLKSNNLSVGTVLTIPLDKPKTAAVSSNSGSPSLSTSSSSAPSSQKTYKVQEGDSFWSIASKMLGSGAEWEKIARANPSVNPDSLRVGSTLVIP